MLENSANLEVDIAILGGGLAGLSLATELAAPQFSHLKVVVIEPREVYKRDKTWSYWRQAQHAFSAQESAVWHAWQLKNTQNAVTIESKNAENYVYASIASDDFYKAALDKIAACQHVSLLQSVSVEALDVIDSDAIVLLKNGAKLIVKRAIFDSRSAEMNEDKHLTQHFVGLQLIAQSPTFDVNIVNLMHFKSSSHGVHFMYVLPYSATDALVESTWLCHHHRHEDYAQELHSYIAERWPNIDFKVKYTETGSLPLLNQQNREYWLANIPVIPIGARAGTARAATGYAFLETLADSARLANLLKQNLPLTAFKRNKIDAWMDAVFLSFLSQHANLAANYFVQMFANCSPARLIRFLTGQANWLDRLSVMRAMPAKPILINLLANIFKH